MSRRSVLPQVISGVEAMESELLVAEAGELSPEQGAAVTAVRGSLTRAGAIATGDDVPGNRLAVWWRGTQIESAHLHLHAARVAIVDVYDDDGLAAEIPRAVARVQGGLHRDDPRRLGADVFTDKDPRAVRAMLRRLVEDGYEATDQQHQRLRSFRNITLLATAAVVLVMGVTLVVVRNDPTLLPLCFTETVPATGTGAGDGVAAATTACPSSNDATGPTGDDILIVALMGLLGGLLSAVFSLRNLRGTSTAYDAPVALAVLKTPLGALTAVTGLVLVHGEFIPGLSALDSQGQILAYAFLFGVGQQVFTRLVDQKAQSILDGIPSKDAAGSPGEPMSPSTSLPSTPPSATVIPTVTPDVDAVPIFPGEPALFDQTPAEELRPNPEDDDPDPVQDDDSDIDGDAPERDHT
jgi:hypothetical protein